MVLISILFAGLLVASLAVSILMLALYYLTAEQVDPYGTPGNSNPISLAADQYLVLGDNSRASRDARFFGPLPVDSVKGVVRCTYWPPTRIHTFVPVAEPADR